MTNHMNTLPYIVYQKAKHPPNTHFEWNSLFFNLFFLSIKRCLRRVLYKRMIIFTCTCNMLVLFYIKRKKKLRRKYLQFIHVPNRNMHIHVKFIRHNYFFLSSVRIIILHFDLFFGQIHLMSESAAGPNNSYNNYAWRISPFFFFCCYFSFS